MDDTQIIALFLARDENAIHETDLAYGRRLHTLANRILLSREDAEESVSDTYLETWKVIPPYRPKYFFAFLASICRHISLNRLDWKLAAKRKADVVSLTEEGVAPSAANTMPSTPLPKEIAPSAFTAVTSDSSSTRTQILLPISFPFWYVEVFHSIPRFQRRFCRNGPVGKHCFLGSFRDWAPLEGIL